MAVKTRNHEFEKIIINAILKDKDFAKKILSRNYTEEIFDVPLNKFIFKKAKERFEKSSDQVTFADLKYITDKLVKDDKEKALKLSQLESYETELQNLKQERDRYNFCWEELLRLFQTRTFFDVVEKGIDGIKDPNADPLKVISDIERRFHEVKKKSNEIKTYSEDIFTKESVDKRFNSYQKEEGKSKKDYLPYFLPTLSNSTGGIKKTDLILVAARQKVGKSIFLLNEGIYLSKLGYNVIYVSVEQSKEEICLRADSLITELKHIDIKFRKLDEHSKALYQSRLSQLPKLGKFICIDIPRGCTTTLIEREVRAKIDEGISINLIIIDYLGLINGSVNTENTHLSVGNITKELKELARDLQVPILTAQQLNRSSEKEKVKTASGFASSDAIGAHVDYAFALVPQSEGRLQVQTVLARDSDAITVDCLTNYERMLIMEQVSTKEQNTSEFNEEDLLQ